MRIETDRLVLSPWLVEEAEILLDIRSRPAVAQWLSDPAPWTEIERATRAIEEWHQDIGREPPIATLAVRPTGAAAVGSVTLARLPGDDVEIEIGWYLHPDATGRGYAQEAAAAMLAEAFQAGVARVWAIMWPHNEPSAAVAGRIGMEDLGVLDDPWYGTPEEPRSRMFRAENSTEA